jgi:patched 1 protein
LFPQDRIEKLWVESGGRLDTELNYVEETLGAGAGGVNQMVIQTVDDDVVSDGSDDMLLTPDSMLRHLEVLRRATRVTVQRDDV